MGRQATKLKVLRDGFYLEVRNKNATSGVKLRRDNKEQMLRAVEEYERSKDVILLGEIENGKIVRS